MEDEEQTQTQKQQIDKFKKGMENKLTDAIVLASWATMEGNAKRDKKCKGLKRKASSKCCVYCMSHEGTYSFNSVNDGAMGGRHEACKCKIFAIFSRDMKTQKLTELYEDYKKSGYSVDKAKRYLVEAEKCGDIIYKKPLSSFTKRDERDLFVHVALHHKGIKFTVRSENAPEGFSNIDLKMKGRLWEVKSPTAQIKKGRIRFVNSNLVKAINQFKNHFPLEIKKYRVILSNRYTAYSDDVVLEELLKEVKKLKITECIMIKKDGEVLTVS